jgi:hypothetical protein
MFSGEALCLLPFALRRWYKAATRAVPLTADEAAERTQRLRGSFAAFSLPALCDAGASTLLNLGCAYTPHGLPPGGRAAHIVWHACRLQQVCAVLVTCCQSGLLRSPQFQAAAAPPAGSFTHTVKVYAPPAGSFV